MSLIFLFYFAFFIHHLSYLLSTYLYFTFLYTFFCSIPNCILPSFLLCHCLFLYLYTLYPNISFPISHPYPIALCLCVTSLLYPLADHILSMTNAVLLPWLPVVGYIRDFLTGSAVIHISSEHGAYQTTIWKTVTDYTSRQKNHNRYVNGCIGYSSIEQLLILGQL